MRIKKFKLDDLRTDWHLDEATFDSLNLLVGISGAGKTKVLDALRRVCRIATEGDHDPGLVAWAVDFEHGGQTYLWEGRTGTATGAAPPGRSGPATVFARERVTVGEANATCLFERDTDGFTFCGAALPALEAPASALFLLKESDALAPLARAFNSILPSAATSTHPLSLVPGHAASIRASIDDLRAVSAGRDAFESFREGWAQAGLPALAQGILMVAFYIQEVFPEQFRDVERQFTAIFPSVRAVRVLGPGGRGRGDHPLEEAAAGTAERPGWPGWPGWIEWSVQEAGTGASNDGWIPHLSMSTGMLRTLVHLFEIQVAPPGSVILIDELENSLGVNCMPALTRLMRSRTPELQFVLTTHRPDVIEEIPVDAWQVVTRKLGRVRVKRARDIAALLQAASPREAFERLIALHELAAPVA